MIDMELDAKVTGAVTPHETRNTWLNIGVVTPVITGYTKPAAGKVSLSGGKYRVFFPWSHVPAFWMKCPGFFCNLKKQVHGKINLFAAHQAILFAAHQAILFAAHQAILFLGTIYFFGLDDFTFSLICVRLE